MKLSNWTLLKCWLLALLAGIPLIPCHATDAPKCAPTPIPVQITEVAKSAPWPNKSYDSGWAFDRFVDKITKHLVTVQAREQLCFDNADGKRPSLLTFEKWPDFTAGNEPFKPTTAIAERPAHGCRIISPWIDIAVEKKPTARIRAIVRWNPRQFFVDQAVLRGKPKVYADQPLIPLDAAALPPGVAQPLSYDEFSRFAEAYIADHPMKIRTLLKGESQEEFLKRVNELWVRQRLVEARMPPDVVLLLGGTERRSSGPTTDLARRILHYDMSKHADDYTKLVMALMDRCVASEGVDMNYSSIRDAADLISLEKYQMYLGIPD